MYAFLLASIICKITPDLSVDQKTLSLKGENEILTQLEFRKYGIFSELVTVSLNGFNTLDSYALAGCSSLKTLNLLGSDLRTINSNCFEKCSSITSITIPHGVTTIFQRAFYQCTSLISITFPSTLDNFYYSFQFSSDPIQEIIVTDGESRYSTAKDNTILLQDQTIAILCAHIPHIVIPSVVTQLADYFITDAYQITQITFEGNSNLEQIGANSFRNTGITTLIFPNSLKVIKSAPFEYSKISTLYLPASLTEVASDIFVGQPLDNLTIEDGITALNVDKEHGTITSKDNKTIMYIKPDTPSIEIKTQTESIPKGLIQSIKTMKSLKVINSSIFFDFGNVLYNSTSKSLIASPGGLEDVVVYNECTSIDSFAFNGCNVKTIDFNGAPITTINTASFGECPFLVQFTMPLTVRYMTDYCFTTTNLVGIDIIFGEDFQQIHSYCFYKCKIRSVDFSRVKAQLTIFPSTFQHCKELQEVKFPQNCKQISTLAFGYCSSLKSIDIPAAVRLIQENSFYGCDSLHTVNFLGESNLTEVQSNAFYSCNISTLTLPDSVTVLYTKSFSYNKYMSKFIMSEECSLGILYPSVLEGCQSIEEIRIGKNLNTTLTGALAYMSGLLNIKVSSDNQWYSDVDGVLHSKDRKRLIMCPGGKTSLAVTEIVESFEKSSFIGCAKLISISMNEDQNISIIPEKTFFGCTSLADISIPRRVKEISAEAFYGCTAISTVVFSKNSELTSLGSSAFSGCTNLTDVIFEEGSKLQNIEADTFAGCSQLTHFTFGGELEKIGARAFKGCKLTDHISFGPKLVSIGDECFSGNIAMTEVVLPASIRSLGLHCFTGCSNLRRIISCSNESLLNDVMNSNEIISGKTLFFVPNTYSHSTAGGFPPIRAVDRDCNIATAEFTNGGEMADAVSLTSLWLSSLCTSDDGASGS